LKSKKKKRIIICVCLVLVASLTVWLVVRKGNAPVEVRVQDITRGDMVQSFSATGKLTSTKTKTYYMLSNATIVNNVNVREGDRVSKGDIMVDFDKTAAELSIKQLEIQVSSAKSTLATARDGVKRIDAGLKELDKAIAQLEAQSSSPTGSAVLSVNELKRVVDEAIKTATPEQKPALEAIQIWLNSGEAENAIGSLNLAGAGSALSGGDLLTTLKAQRETLATSRPTEEQINMLSQAAVLAENGLEASKKQNDIVMSGAVAEFDGIVTSVSVSPGAPVSMGSDVITIADPSTLIATINLQKYDVDQVKMGQTAEVTMFGETSEASVSYIGFKSSGGSSFSAAALLAGATGDSGGSSSSDIFAEIKISNPNDKFILNYECDVTITTGEASNALILPIEAVKINREGSYCFVLKGETVIKSDLTLGISNDYGYVVTEGLNDSDRVIINPSNLVVDGAEVVVKK